MANRKAFLQDVATTVKRISDFWPDFPIVANSILKPTHEFVVGFYERFVNDAKGQIQGVLTEEDSKTEPDTEVPEGGRDLDYLLIELVKIYSRLNTPKFLLTDLYDPQPTRTHIFFKMSIHFLVFVNNNMEELSNVAAESLKKISETKNKRMLEQQFLVDTGDNAENIARMQDTNRKTKIKKEKIDLQYEEMLMVKKEEDKRYEDKLALKNALELEIDNLECELQYAETEEKELEKRIITDADFENMQKTGDFLTLSLEQMSADYKEIDVELNSIIENYEEMENVAKIAKNLNYDCLLVETSLERKEEIKGSNIQREAQLAEQKALLKEKTDKTKAVNTKKCIKEEGRKTRSEYLADAALQSENDMKTYENELSKHRSNVEKSQRLKSSIIKEEEEIEKLKDHQKCVEQLAELHLQTFLRANDYAASTAIKVLENLKNIEI